MVFKAYPGEQKDYRIIVITLTIIAILLLFARIGATIRNRGWLGLEDGFVIMATSCLVVFASFMYTATTYGFGLQLAEIKEKGGNPILAMKYFWLTLPMYTLTNGFNKMAFLALFYRVFPMKRFRQACLVLGAISVGWTVGYLFVSIFQCNPLPRVYNRTIPGTCIDFAWHRWSNASLNLATDIAIFVLPMPVIFRLNMSIGNKIGLVVLFSMGFFICLTTALRMFTLSQSLKAKQPTYESAPANLWSFIEAATGVICACLISLRKSIGALWPARWRSTKGSTGGYQQYGSGGLSTHGLSVRARNGTGTGHTYPLSDVKTSKKGASDTYGSVSPSESQERITHGAKTEALITTSRSRSCSRSGSDDLVLQGITVRTDVKVIRT